MNKIIVIPDSFKGSLGTVEICNIAEKSIKKFFPQCEVVKIPVADGGEGTVQCFYEALGGEKIKVNVKGPWKENIVAEYVKKDSVAIIEMASCAGLPLVDGRLNPSLTTTYGVGEVIIDAINRGSTNIILGLGGSCTNDGGCGCAAALGVSFKDENLNEFIPVGATLSKIKYIDISKAHNLLKGCNITVMCDIENPMYGQNGAAYIYGPQKGADKEMVVFLDEQLRELDKVMKSELKMESIADHPGTGAAGAMGAGMMAFLGAELKSGIETVLDIVNFDEKLNNTDLIITGEGKIDSQSLKGKVVIGISKRALKKRIPVIAIVGDVGDDSYEAYNLGVSAIFSINRLAIPFSEARVRSRIDYTNTLEDVLRLLSIKNI
ncbi:Glycerate kinase [uncultured Clostridium sp.]|uniref:glycerate kinase family protein n=1 Tax=uncultured Clostridium sp. TaxID=59620 RepID=UPI000820DC82|nr:glycerate kinase [uncultured Clostridium sp.]SCJ99878.1 Glycerate kinase [uncultured Clostridium sp.]